MDTNFKPKPYRGLKKSELIQAHQELELNYSNLNLSYMSLKMKYNNLKTDLEVLRKEKDAEILQTKESLCKLHTLWSVKFLVWVGLLKK
jgi:hypothetical protein